MSAFGGKANIALTCRLVSNMAQRHFLLALTMATEARPRRGTDLIREVLHPEYQSAALGGSSRECGPAPRFRPVV